MRFASNLLVTAALLSAGFAPVEAARIFEPDQQTLLKGVEPSVPSAGGCTWPTTATLAVFDASDLTTLFTDVAGTTNVTADGDPVGRWVDKNGSGYYIAAAADNTTRPTYHTSGGLEWVEFDRSNDILYRQVALGVYSSVTSTAALAIQHTAAGQGSIYAEMRSDNGTPKYTPSRNNSADFNDAMFTYTNDAGTPVVVNVDYYNEAYGANTDISFIVTDSGSTLTGYLDGANGGAPISYTRSTYTPDTFSIGGRRATSASDFFGGRVYYARFYSDVKAGADLTMIDTCLKATQGR